MNGRKDRVEAIFQAAIELSSREEREAYLQRECGQDTELRREVEDLLRAAVEAEDIFETPASRPALEQVGSRIGNYHLLQKIGEGGCGVVYMAEQEAPVRRKVAFKIVKLGMDTRQVIARFEAERQALALMDHPNIAKVLDAGATETGRPYFVMELVRGQKITQYCDEQRFSTVRRLELFIQVCQAVQHAHQKGIIHRDLKPSNILVTERDGVPVPKVIDFGIAKATGDLRLTDKTLFTAFEQFIGTPAYMSPEQARLGELDIDTRSDIYSLGVLLYELLTGKTPFDTRELLAAGLDEMRRAIREQDPPHPSARLTTLSAPELETTAGHRGVVGLRLVHLLRGDLDCIVMKCMEKDRSRRYETANGLAMDISRHLNNEPVIARPSSQLYRFLRLARRNKRAFAAAGVASGALIIGLALSAWQYVEKSRAYGRALSAEAKEKSAREKAQQAQSDESAQRKMAQATATRLAEALNLLQLQNAEQLFAADNSSAAVGYLTRVLRQDPTNEVAAQRLLSALTYRTFVLPSLEPLKHDSVISAEFSPDGQRLLTAGNKTARIWDLHTGRVLSELTLELSINWAFFSADGLRIVTACGAGYDDPHYVQVWDATTARPVTESFKHEGFVSSIRFSADGQKMITASLDVANATPPNKGTFRIWDVNSGRQILLQTMRCSTNRLSRAELSPDGQRVLTACVDGTAQVWDIRSGQPIGQEIKHNSYVTSVEFSKDGQRVLTAASSERAYYFSFRPILKDAPFFSGARVWDSSTGLPLTPLLPHENGVSYARFSPDGLRVVTASPDGTARVWDAQSGQPLTEPLKHDSAVISAEFSPDGLRILTVSEDKTVRIWDVKTGRPLTESIKHKTRVASAHFSPDGQRLVTAAFDTIRVWDTRPRLVPADTLTSKSWLLAAQFSPDGKRLMTAWDDGTMVVSGSDTGRSMVQLLHSNGLESASFNPNGSRLLTTTLNGENTIAKALQSGLFVWNRENATVWDTATGRPVSTLLNVRWAQFSPDGLSVLTMSQDSTARICDVQTGQPMTEPFQNAGKVRNAQFSPDGKQVLTVSNDKTTRLWDAQTGGLLIKLSAIVEPVEFSPDGLLLVTVSNNAVQFWDAKTGRDMLKPLLHEDRVLSVLFSPNSRLVVTTCENNTARVWDVATGRPLTGPLLRDAKVSSAKFSPDGRRIVTTFDTARVWDVATGQPISEPLAGSELGGIWLVDFSPDGKRLITDSRNTVRLWELPPVPLPVPNWVIDLAEAVTDTHIDEQGVSQSVPFADLQTLKSRINESNEVDVWTRWAKWLLAEPANRAISPFTAVSKEQ